MNVSLAAASLPSPFFMAARSMLSHQGTFTTSSTQSPRPVRTDFHNCEGQMLRAQVAGLPSPGILSTSPDLYKVKSIERLQGFVVWAKSDEVLTLEPSRRRPCLKSITASGSCLSPCGELFRNRGFPCAQTSKGQGFSLYQFSLPYKGQRCTRYHVNKEPFSFLHEQAEWRKQLSCEHL